MHILCITLFVPKFACFLTHFWGFHMLVKVGIYSVIYLQAESLLDPAAQMNLKENTRILSAFQESN